MAVILGESLLDNGGLDGADLFERFRTWGRSARIVAGSHDQRRGSQWGLAARRSEQHFKRTGPKPAEERRSG